jgi:lysophospholipase L1-like esterase
MMPPTDTAGPFSLYTIGDSTMADYDPVTSPNQRGWGQMLRQFLVGDDVTFVNAARNGRSSKSFYEEGLWNGVKTKLEAADYVFIQFAHNDEGADGIEGPDGISTAAFGAFHDYLGKYVDETRAAGALPILVTPVVRRYFSGATLTAVATHDLTGNGTAVGDANYVESMKDVGTTKDVPVIDMTASTKALVEQYGPTDAKAIIYVSTDDTHLQPLGATLFAQLAVQELIAKGIIATHLNPSADLVVSPSSADFGGRFVSTTLDKTFTVTGLSLMPDSGNVAITAPDGFLVSAGTSERFAASTQIAYAGGKLPPTSFSVRFQPPAVQSYMGNVTVSLDSGDSKTIAVTGNGLTAPEGSEESVVYPLTADGSCASATGFATCAPEALSNLYVRNYQAVGSFPVSQRASILNPTTPDSWPADVDMDPTRYIEFAVSPLAGKKLTVDAISMNAGAAGGNGMGFRIQYSTQEDFGAAVELGAYPTNVSNMMTLLSFTPIIAVDTGVTLRVRVFPWNKAVATGKFMCLQTVTVHGTIQ